MTLTSRLSYLMLSEMGFQDTNTTIGNYTRSTTLAEAPQHLKVQVRHGGRRTAFTRHFAEMNTKKYQILGSSQFSYSWLQYRVKRYDRGSHTPRCWYSSRIRFGLRETYWIQPMWLRNLQTRSTTRWKSQVRFKLLEASTVKVHKNATLKLTVLVTESQHSC